MRTVQTYCLLQRNISEAPDPNSLITCLWVILAVIRALSFSNDRRNPAPWGECVRSFVMSRSQLWPTSRARMASVERQVPDQLPAVRIPQFLGGAMALHG